MDRAARDEIRQRIDSSRPEDDDALSDVNIMLLLDALDTSEARVAVLEAEALEDRLALAQISSDYRYIARHSRIDGAKENLEQFGIVDGKVKCVRGGGGPA